MAKYVSEEILVDGIHINEDINAKKWTAESDEFWFAKAQSERGLTIYNKGVYVTTYNHSKFGVSGDLISRNKNFDVNMARNDVLQSTCELWKLIPSFVKPFTVKKQQAKKLTDQDRIFLIAQMLKGEIHYDDVRSKRLFQNADGKYASLKQLVTHASGKITIAPSRWKQSAGNGLHSKKIAFCLSYDFLEQHNFETLNDFIIALKECGMFINDYTFKLDLLSVVPFESAASTVNENHDIIPEDKLTALDLARLKATRAMYKSLLEQYIYIERCSGRVDEPHTFAGQENFKRKSEREVNVGRSELAEAWTDGQSYIAIEVGVLRSSFENGLNGLLNLISIITHEMCHENTYISKS